MFKFKIGDKVKVVGINENFSDHSKDMVGMIGIVKDTCQCPNVFFQDLNQSIPFYQTRLELATPGEYVGTPASEGEWSEL